MDDLLKIAALIAAFVAMNVLGNKMAQRVFPTNVDDSFARRLGYRFVFVFVLAGSLVILAFLADVLDI